jgi:hypothetical protein
MDATMSMFRLMVLSPSVETKITILELTHKWVFKQLNPKSLRPPKRDYVQDLKEYFKKSVEKINEQADLPSLKSKAELLDYVNEARTHYQDRDAPKF